MQSMSLFTSSNFPSYSSTPLYTSTNVLKFRVVQGGSSPEPAWQFREDTITLRHITMPPPSSATKPQSRSSTDIAAPRDTFLEWTTTVRAGEDVVGAPVGSSSSASDAAKSEFEQQHASLLGDLRRQLGLSGSTRSMTLFDNKVMLLLLPVWVGVHTSHRADCLLSPSLSVAAAAKHTRQDR